MNNNKKIPLSKIYISSEIKRKVCDILDSGQYILAKECEAFEDEFAKFIGRKYAILTGSGTTAVYLTLLSLGVSKGDEIIVPSHTAFPTVEPILNIGAYPVFVDIDNTYTIDPSKIEEKITKKTVGIIPVHIYGHPANMSIIMKIAKKKSLFILEDCCQAHGAKFENKYVGSFGDAGCFSFYPSKNMTVCGDGGIIVTDKSSINKRIRMLRDHGRISKYIHKLSGYNERFNEIQAAIGREQLKKLKSFNSRRREIAALYVDRLKTLPIILPEEMKWAYHVYHLFVIRVENRDRLAEFLLKNGIGTGIHYPVPCHLQPAVKGKVRGGRLPKTEAYCHEILSLPIHPMLSNKEVDYICEKTRNFFF